MQIVEIARQYIGKKEKPGNTGFVDPEFEKEMRAIGWVPGHAWCAYFCDMVFFKATKNAKLKELIVPSAVNSYRNLVRASYQSSKVPKVGALVFWQRMKDGNPQWQGHAGIVSEVISPTKFKSIEGNTNSLGSREGDSVQEKIRTVSDDVENGLKVLGFITV